MLEKMNFPLGYSSAANEPKQSSSVTYSSVDIFSLRFVWFSTDPLDMFNVMQDLDQGVFAKQRVSSEFENMIPFSF